MNKEAGEYIAELSKAAPPVTVTGFSLVGVPLETWVLVSTLVYTLLNIGWFVYDKLIRRRKR